MSFALQVLFSYVVLSSYSQFVIAAFASSVRQLCLSCMIPFVIQRRMQFLMCVAVALCISSSLQLFRQIVISLVCPSLSVVRYLVRSLVLSCFMDVDVSLVRSLVRLSVFTQLVSSLCMSVVRYGVISLCLQFVIERVRQLCMYVVSSLLCCSPFSLDFVRHVVMYLRCTVHQWCSYVVSCVCSSCVISLWGYLFSSLFRQVCVRQSLFNSLIIHWVRSFVTVCVTS